MWVDLAAIMRQLPQELTWRTSRETGRGRQRRRTRKDLLPAASRLMKKGRKPSLEEVAEEAMVSRATAYRYFPSVEALLLEASLDVAVPDAAEVFGDGAADDPVARLERVDTALHDMILRQRGAAAPDAGALAGAGRQGGGDGAGAGAADPPDAADRGRARPARAHSSRRR